MLKYFLDPLFSPCISGNRTVVEKTDLFHPSHVRLWAKSWMNLKWSGEQRESSCWRDQRLCLTLSLPESVTETFTVLVSFESVGEILWCDHSNDTSSVVLSPDEYFTKSNLGLSWILILGTLVSKRVKRSALTRPLSTVPILSDDQISSEGLFMRPWRTKGQDTLGDKSQG